MWYELFINNPIHGSTGPGAPEKYYSRVIAFLLIRNTKVDNLCSKKKYAGILKPNLPWKRTGRTKVVP